LTQTGTYACPKIKTSETNVYYWGEPETKHGYEHNCNQISVNGNSHRSLGCYFCICMPGGGTIFLQPYNV